MAELDAEAEDVLVWVGTALVGEADGAGVEEEDAVEVDDAAVDAGVATVGVNDGARSTLAAGG